MSSSRIRPGWVLVAILIGLSAGGLLGWAATPRLPGEISAEAGFARDMQSHHAQAVELSLILRERSDDPILRSLALDIATSQQHQIGQMAGWLATWGVSPTGRQPVMAWMGAAEHHVPTDGAAARSMPGMATETDIAHLIDATGTVAEVRYLRLMIVHHRGGVAMAEAIADSGRPEVNTLARAMISSQSSELATMTRLLEERGSAP